MQSDYRAVAPLQSMLHDDETRSHRIMPLSHARSGADSGRQPPRLLFICAVLILMSCANPAAQAQSLNARLSVVSLTPPRVRVEVERAQSTKVWSFRSDYAGLVGLDERIQNLSLSDAQGVKVAARKFAPGKYEAEREATKIVYELKLDPPRATNDATHIHGWLPRAAFDARRPPAAAAGTHEVDSNAARQLEGRHA
jgi:hypothetical protein